MVMLLTGLSPGVYSLLCPFVSLYVCSLITADEMKTSGAASTTRVITLRLLSAVKTRVCFDLEEWTISGLQYGQGCDI